MFLTIWLLLIIWSKLLAIHVSSLLKLELLHTDSLLPQLYSLYELTASSSTKAGLLADRYECQSQWLWDWTHCLLHLILERDHSNICVSRFAAEGVAYRPRALYGGCVAVGLSEFCGCLHLTLPILGIYGGCVCTLPCCGAPSHT